MSLPKHFLAAVAAEGTVVIITKKSLYEMPLESFPDEQVITKMKDPINGRVIASKCKYSKNRLLVSFVDSFILLEEGAIICSGSSRAERRAAFCLEMPFSILDFYNNAVVGANAKFLELWLLPPALSNKKSIKNVYLQNQISAISAVYIDRKYIVTGNTVGALGVFDALFGSLELKIDTEKAFQPNNTTVISKVYLVEEFIMAVSGNSIGVWTLNGGVLLDNIKLKSTILSVKYIEHTHRVAVLCGGNNKAARSTSDMEYIQWSPNLKKYRKKSKAVLTFSGSSTFTSTSSPESKSYRRHNSDTRGTKGGLSHKGKRRLSTDLTSQNF
eukprot:CAMPEP_0168528526 /NCGR_PEP_ID=MMETSP0405-20121227/13306_1 /TAXON_ID=498012 /ORGANISM="Trichosphaerium sp, Strain Am-I-7 wt" /LENGTH=327 /DNA_ID=CAMNT_0008551957 /DNA_START=371 /DNA_END=1354 /DNA_ORIENTATION=-